MRLRRRTREHAEVSTESLNDIMFFLLLFFLIISTLSNPNVVKLALPNSKQAQQMNKQPITVSVTKDLQYSIDKTPVAFNELEESLRQRLLQLEEPTVVLRFDQELTVQDLVDVL